MANSLIIPIIMWGKKPPTHRISSVVMTSDLRTIITGCRDGQLLVWDYENSSIVPKSLLFGHSSCIVSIATLCETSSKRQIVSASDIGELCLWDIDDGRCIEQTQVPGTPTQICSCSFTLGNEMKNCVMCYGQFSEICILDASSLQIILNLASRIFPDWMAAAIVMPYYQTHDTCNIMGLTVSGMLKVWHLHKSFTQSVLFEEESKQIHCPMAIEMKLSKTNCGLLIICSNMWLICDAGDYSTLCSEKAELGQQLVGGDFLTSDIVITWDRMAKVKLYKLPFSGSNQETFRSSLQNHSKDKMMPHQIYSFTFVEKEQLLLPPAALLHRTENLSQLIMGTCDGSITISEVNENGTQHTASSSMAKLWNSLDKKPVGIIDLLGLDTNQYHSITATLFILRYCYLCCGRENGTIVIVPAAKTCRAHLCHEPNNKKLYIPHKTLCGHRDRVTCLLYPFQESPETYSPQLLVSGSADFSVILWDLFAGVLTHSFHVHGGEISQLLAPPDGCNPRIRQSVCSIAQDHSVALLNLKDRKCILMASRHSSPITAIRWRPDDDFLVVSCADSSVFVWQMETGHLDRFEQGTTAADIISACDEIASTKTNAVAQSSVNLSQALKSRSLSLFKAVAQQGLRSLIEGLESQKQSLTESDADVDDVYKAMLISALRASPLHDTDSHVMFMNTEALIARLLMEHAKKTKTKKYSDSVHSDSSPGMGTKRRIFSTLIKQVKNQFLDEESDVSATDIVMTKSKRKKQTSALEVDSAIDIAQIIVSCVHAWGVDVNIDNLCKERLGLLLPRAPVSFGVLSQHGHMALHLPKQSTAVAEGSNLSHWQISSSMTTQHLVSVISIVNTMMALPHACFKQRQMKRLCRGAADSRTESDGAEVNPNEQSQIKQSWSLLATLHCVLLPEKMERLAYKPPRLEMLARRWQDRCLELREAAQALMLAELRQMGASGRRRVVEAWSHHVPDYVYQPSVDSAQLDSPASYMGPDEIGDRSSLTSDELVATFPSAAKLPHEVRRRHATAIVILGVIGAEFGQELEPCGPQRHDAPVGFGISDYSLARHTCKALVFLLLQPASPKLPAHVPLRRAAIDLLGRGFPVWEPYMEVSAVLLGLLELCEAYSQHIGSIQSGYPLSPEADSCRSAHHSLSLIATARPLTFVTTIAREVARYNAAAANPQHQSLLATSVLVRNKAEILRIIELLSDKMMSDLNNVLVEVVDIALFCIDISILRASYGLLEAVPALAKFHTISYDARSRRVAVAGSRGAIVLYDIRTCKHQVVPRGHGRITALCFSPDGRYLCVYCASENQLSFWVTATSLFGMIQSQVKCVKTVSPLKIHSKSPTEMMQPHKLNLTKLVWVNNRSVVLLLPDGAEQKFHI